jgi:hypothetical protein
MSRTRVAWSLAEQPARNPFTYHQYPDMMESEAMTMFGMGDIPFNSRDPHGPPSCGHVWCERSALGDKDPLIVDLDVAFREGTKLAQLRV